MIEIDGKICYSPYPPDQYMGIDEDGNPAGQATLFAKSLEQWNLAWLCGKGFDEFPHCKDNDYILSTLPCPLDQAIAIINVTAGYGRDGEPNPVLGWLRLMPTEFIRAFSTYEIDPRFVAQFDLKLMTQRANLSESWGKQNGNAHKAASHLRLVRGESSLVTEPRAREENQVKVTARKEDPKLGFDKLPSLPIGEDIFFKAIEADNLDVVRRLLVDGHPAACRSPLYLFDTPVSCLKSKAMLDLLVENGLGHLGFFLCNAVCLHNLGGLATLDILQWLIDAGAPVDGEKWDQQANLFRTPLMLTMSTPSIGAFRMLLANGANVHYSRARDRFQAIHELAIKWGQNELSAGESGYRHYVGNNKVYEEMLHSLLKAGVQVDAPDAHGRTPMIYVAMLAGKEAMRCLVRTGGSLLTVDAYGKSVNAWVKGKATRKVFDELLAEYYAPAPDTGELVRA